MKKLSMILAILFAVTAVLTACAGNTPGTQSADDKTETAAPAQESSEVTTAAETTSAAETAEAETTPAETTEEETVIPEAPEPDELLYRFFEKAEQNSFAIKSPDYMDAYVFSEDLVYLDFSGYQSYYMSLNGNELYTVSLDGEESFDAAEIRFLGKGDAVSATDAQPYLLGVWKYYLTDNLWDTFTNHPDEPLRFTVDKESLGGHILEYLAPVPGAYKAAVDTIDLVLADEQVSAAAVEVSFTDESIPTMAVDIEFDIEKGELAVDGWLNDADRVYPESRDAWNDEDEVAFSAVYNQTVLDVMDEAIPFPSEFKTRTFYRYPNYYGEQPRFFITDTLASKEGYEQYVTDLVNVYGFEKHQETIDGETIDRYDRMLYSYRDIYFAYSSIYIEYDEDGVSMEAKLNYNDLTFVGRDSVNEFLKKMHFPELPQSEALTYFAAHDDTLAQSEGYLFMTPYTRSLRVEIRHTDYDLAEAYLMDYYDALEEEGFIRGQGSAFMSKDGGEEYESRLDSGISDDTVYIEFWYIEYMSDEEVAAWMDRYGFPGIDVSQLQSTAKDATKYYEMDAQVYQESIIALDVSFDSVDERNEYMTALARRLVFDEGFEEADDPHKLMIARRDTAFYNAEKGIIIAYDDNALGNTVDFHLIKVADGFEPLP